MDESRRYKATGLGHLLDHQGRKGSWLARECGMSKSHLSRVIAGERTLTEGLARRIADRLQTPLFLLFEFTDVNENITQEEVA